MIEAAFIRESCLSFCCLVLCVQVVRAAGRFEWWKWFAWRVPGGGLCCPVRFRSFALGLRLAKYFIGLSLSDIAGRAKKRSKDTLQSNIGYLAVYPWIHCKVTLDTFSGHSSAVSSRFRWTLILFVNWNGWQCCESHTESVVTCLGIALLQLTFLPEWFLLRFCPLEWAVSLMKSSGLSLALFCRSV